MDVSKRIIELRKEKGLSQYRLAQLSGVPQGAISNYEKNRKPGPDVIEKLCTGLGVTMAEFFSPVMDEPDFDVLADGSVVPPGAETDPRRDELHALVSTLPDDKLEVALRVLKAL